MAAWAYSYSVAIADAAWDFEDTENVRPTATNAAFLVPDTWKTGTSIPAYMPYIYPNGNQTDLGDKGCNSRHCLYLQNPSSASRVPVYAMMPQVNDRAYAGLSIEFMARTFNSSLDVNTSNTVYGDWKIGYITNLADTVKAGFAANVQEIASLDLTPNWTLYSVPLANVPDGAYPVIYVLNADHIRYMFVDDVRIVEGESTGERGTGKASDASVQVREGRVIIVRGGIAYDLCGRAL